MKTTGETIRSGLIELGLRADPSMAEMLTIYLEELEKWNRHFNLVGAGGRELVVRHLLDSLSGFNFFMSMVASVTGEDSSGGIDVLDVGSGAGFPGIPLAIAFGNTKSAYGKVRFTLLERSGRRAVFLENVSIRLGLNNVTVVEEDLKRFERPQSGFDIITTRAFSEGRASDMRLLIGRMIRLLNRSGSIILYKGRLSRVASEIAMLTGIFRHIEVYKVRVPFLEAERHLVVMQKKFLWESE